MKKTILMLLAAVVVGGGLLAQSKEDTIVIKSISFLKSIHDGYVVGYDSSNSSNKPSPTNKIARFPGGTFYWDKFIERNTNPDLGGECIKIPKSKSYSEQIIVVHFVVDIDGTITKVEPDSILNIANDKRLVAEAVRVIKKSPKWNPAIKNDKNVPYNTMQAIKFVSIIDEGH
jgi:hypothetical protein